MSSFVFLGERPAVDLLNTVVAVDGQVLDLLPGWPELVAWAESSGVVSRGELASGAGERHERELAGFRAFREALRRGLRAWAGGSVPSARFVALLNRQLARDPQFAELAVSRKAVRVRPRSTGEPLDRLYAAVARSAAELLMAGNPQRLRKCANPACRLRFYDVSKAGRRRWCSMASCGGRAKVRAYYRRHRATAVRLSPG